MAGYRSGCGRRLLATGQVMVGGCWLQVRSWWEVDGCWSGHGRRWLAVVGQVMGGGGWLRSGHGWRRLATGQVMMGGGWMLVWSWLEVIGCSRSSHSGRLLVAGSVIAGCGCSSDHRRLLAAGSVITGCG